MDFTIDKYKELLSCMIKCNYEFQTFKEFLTEPKQKVIILRHDVDDLPNHSLRLAKLQNELGIKGVYYFRSKPQSWNEAVIQEISSLGHEVGYHYETMDTANGDIEKAWSLFKSDLERLRKLTDVSTVCMHGSPKSKYDNRELWKTKNYKSLGLIGEPYYDLDFNKVLYCTDTGRRWDGHKFSVRDKVASKFTFRLHSTDDIIDHLNDGKLPDHAMFNFHPQRWHDNWFSWSNELIIQNLKNIIKWLFFVEDNQSENMK